ncbi:hypothetical protein KM043_015333 [Ampulex compressa]|nr:hypothetical protein KM043_015333 [Ampulex compressa]
MTSPCRRRALLRLPLPPPGATAVIPTLTAIPTGPPSPTAGRALPPLRLPPPPGVTRVTTSSSRSTSVRSVTSFHRHGGGEFRTMPEAGEPPRWDGPSSTPPVSPEWGNGVVSRCFCLPSLFLPAYSSLFHPCPPTSARGGDARLHSANRAPHGGFTGTVYPSQAVQRSLFLIPILTRTLPTPTRETAAYCGQAKGRAGTKKKEEGQ